MSDIFTDKELDELESNHINAQQDHLDALKHMCNMLNRRVEELEHAFKHCHAANPEAGDACIKCGFDLRDPIHIRIPQGGTEVRLLMRYDYD